MGKPAVWVVLSEGNDLQRGQKPRPGGYLQDRTGNLKNGQNEIQD